MLEQSSKSARMEIRNIPVKKGESKYDLASVVGSLSRAIDCPVEESDIRDVYRINTKLDSNKPIVVNFNSVLLRDKVLNAVKVHNKRSKDMLNTAQLKLEGPSQPIFTSESLTFSKKKLFFMARDFAKTHEFQYCWTSHGKIYVRKKEGDRFQRLDSEEDLLKLRAATPKK